MSARFNVAVLVSHPAVVLFKNPVGEHSSVPFDAVAPGSTSTMIKLSMSIAAKHDARSAVRRTSTTPNTAVGGRSQNKVPSAGGLEHSSIIWFSRIA